MKTNTLSLVFILALVCFALSPQAQAQCPQICDSNSNTALGNDALVNNTTGSFSTAIGVSALSSNSSGGNNTAIGFQALLLNTTGSLNTAVGNGALWNNTTGFENTATGVNALQGNISGINNTANGFYALNRNTTGKNNAAIGSLALLSNTTGGSNIALGVQAGRNLTTGSNNIDIGNVGAAREANTIRIGTTGTQTATFIAGVSGATVPTGVAVIVDSDGHLGTIVSSERFKEAIKPMDKASETILALKPVTFCYKHELDPNGIPQFGLVAEDVEKVNPDLVARDDQGKPYTVRYEAVNAMLLNEFLKEHCKVESLEKAMAEQQKENAAMRAMLKEQAAQIQKVSAQLEVSKPAPQTVLNNQ
jgi:trimeric autotransporter adhesin